MSWGHMGRSEVRSPLRDLPIFATCSEGGRPRPEGMLQVVTVPGQAVLVREGAVGRYVCLGTGGRA